MADDDGAPPPAIRIEMAPNATPLEFLEAVFRHNDVPLGMRLDAAKNAAQYRHPKLQMHKMLDDTNGPLVIEGGLPMLPGVETRMPQRLIEGEVVRPAPPAKPEPDDGA